MKTDKLFVGHQEIASIQVEELTPAKVFVINEYLKNKTKEAVFIDVDGNVYYTKDNPYEAIFHEGYLRVYQLTLIPEEYISKGIRLTPIE